MIGNEIDILARTLYGEAAAGDELDAIAIAHVVCNRVSYSQWPNTIQTVCLQPWQFSCWNQNDPNRDRIMNVSPEDPWFRKCQGIARQVLEGAIPDPTNRATHYYANYIKPPLWVKGHTPCYVDLPHIYFNDIDTPAPATAADALDQNRPLTRTRTIINGQVAAVGTAVAAAAEILDPVKDHIAWLAQYSTYAKWLAIAVVTVGVIGMIWARIDDRRRGLR